MYPTSCTFQLLIFFSAGVASLCGRTEPDSPAQLSQVDDAWKLVEQKKALSCTREIFLQ